MDSDAVHSSVRARASSRPRRIFPASDEAEATLIASNETIQTNPLGQATPGCDPDTQIMLKVDTRACHRGCYCSRTLTHTEVEPDKKHRHLTNRLFSHR